jgi:hypothetical protein
MKLAPKQSKGSSEAKPRIHLIGTMITAEYLKPPPEHELPIVEHSTKHTVVLKPGFYNRRNQSQYLKNSFPAGFLIKNKLTDQLGKSVIRDAVHKNPYGSYTDWTKGESETMNDSVSADLTYPYADVAGPYLTDILANRSTVQKKLIDTNKHSSIIATELPLHHRSQKLEKPKPRVKHHSLLLRCSVRFTDVVAAILGQLSVQAESLQCTSAVAYFHTRTESK